MAILLCQTGSMNLESHLLGAYSYAASEPIDFSTSGILQVGAWNYLREEITVGLIQRRGVRMGQIFEDHLQNHAHNILPSDQISYTLAKIINFCFADFAQAPSPVQRRAQWHTLNQALQRWAANLPASYTPFSRAKRKDNPFPSFWMLQPCHSM